MAIDADTGIETGVITIIRILRGLPGSGREETHVPAQQDERRRSCLENLLALEERRWYPEVALEEGLARTLSFFRPKIRTSGTW